MTHDRDQADSLADRIFAVSRNSEAELAAHAKHLGVDPDDAVAEAIFPTWSRFHRKDEWKPTPGRVARVLKWEISDHARAVRRQTCREVSIETLFREADHE